MSKLITNGALTRPGPIFQRKDILLLLALVSSIAATQIYSGGDAYKVAVLLAIPVLFLVLTIFRLSREIDGLRHELTELEARVKASPFGNVLPRESKATADKQAI